MNAIGVSCEPSVQGSHVNFVKLQTEECFCLHDFGDVVLNQLSHIWPHAHFYQSSIFLLVIDFSFFCAVTQNHVQDDPPLEFFRKLFDIDLVFVLEIVQLGKSVFLNNLDHVIGLWFEKSRRKCGSSALIVLILGFCKYDWVSSEFSKASSFDPRFGMVLVAVNVNLLKCLWGSNDQIIIWDHVNSYEVRSFLSRKQIFAD